MRLSDEQIQKIVQSRISVTHQEVAVMKGLLLANFRPLTEYMIASAVEAVGFRRPNRLILNSEIDNTVEVQRLGDYFSKSVCAAEAVWDLINAGILLPVSSNVRGIATTVQIAHVSGGGSSVGPVDFVSQVQALPFPETVAKRRRDHEGYLLSDPDLYLQAVRPQGLPSDIGEALTEAVRCFRADLYLACAVMLGKASEGIWIELGKALIETLPKAEQPARDKLRKDLDNTVRPSFAQKLREIHKLFETCQAQFKAVMQASGVGLDQFRAAYQWAELVRDSRNIVHYGSQPNVPNNYTNVATLLLAGSAHLRVLLQLHEAATAHPSQ